MIFPPTCPLGEYVSVDYRPLGFSGKTLVLFPYPWERYPLCLCQRNSLQISYKCPLPFALWSELLPRVHCKSPSAEGSKPGRHCTQLRTMLNLGDRTSYERVSCYSTIIMPPHGNMCQNLKNQNLKWNLLSFYMLATIYNFLR